jgi:hypothetical protein
MKVIDLINSIPTSPEKTESPPLEIATAKIPAGECECPPPPPPSERKIVGRIWA